MSYSTKLQSCGLFKVLNTALEDQLIFCSVDILGKVAADDTFTVTHLTQHAAVRRGDAFNRHNRSIGIEVDIIGGVAFQIDILGRNLTIGCHLRHQFRSRNEPSFTVRNRDHMIITDRGVIQPGRLVGCDAGTNHHRLMAADRVESQGRRVVFHLNNLAKGHQTQFNQSLETVADTQHQAIPLFKQGMYTVFNARVAEESSDKFAAAVRFVTTGEAAGNHDDLALSQTTCELVDRLFDIRTIQVTDDKDISLCTGLFKGARGIIFAVGTREYRNQDAGTRNLNRGRQSGFGCIGKGLGLAFGNSRQRMIDLFELFFVRILEVI